MSPPPLRDDGRWIQDARGVWHHPEQGSWIRAQDGLFYPARSSSTGRTVVWVVGLGLLIGGCTFVVVEPVVALAIVFVGIPFALLVVWLMAALMPRR